MNPLSSWMRKRRTQVAGWSILLLVLPSVWGQAAEGAQRPFGTGESLKFDVYYGPLKAGSARMEVGSVGSVRGRDCLHLISTAQSSPVVSAFFRVDDRVESWLDMEHLRPMKFEKHLREGRYMSDHVVDFYHEEGEARTSDRVLPISLYTQDALSVLYWIRTQEIQPGQTIWMSSISSRNAYDLRIEITGRERVRTPAGEFDCLVVEPHLARDGGIFDQKGRMWVWLTDDVLRLPVQMVSKVAIGSIKAVLVDHVLGTVTSSADDSD